MVSHHSIASDWEDLVAEDLEHDERDRKRARPPRDRTRRRKPDRRPPRNERDQVFRCGRCRQFIGAPPSGGRHRNHCPNCLHSRHVDLKHPGDRRSDCASLMRPRGLMTRRNGEQMILHECLGCGKTQPTRVAADDNPVRLMRLEPIGLPENMADTATPFDEEETA